MKLHNLLPRKMNTKKLRNYSRREFTRTRRVFHETLESRHVLTAYIVDTTADVIDDTDGVTSLREAITAANTNAVSGDAPAGQAGPGVTDSISFAASLSGQTITLGGSELAITDQLTISDSNATAITIDADGQSRVLNIEAGASAVSLSDITITGGSSDQGGGILLAAEQELNLSNVTISGNTATAEGGGIYNAGGSLSIDGGSISGNTASGAASDQGGGGVFNAGGTVEILNATISNNEADGAAGSGGGILNDAGGTLTISGGSITGNIAVRAGGGIEDNSGAGTTVTLTDVSLDNNNTGVQPAAAGTAPGNGGGLHVTGAGNVSITGGTVNGNVAAAEGGGLWNGSGTMTIDGTTIDDNTASGAGSDQGGGGVFNAGGTVEILNAAITNNDADGAAGSGGGILNDGGVLTVDSTTIDSNTSVRAGGGIEDTAVVSGTLTTLTDVTLSGNSTGNSPGNGGGLHLTGAGTVSITGGEVTGNTAGSEGGGLWNSSNGMLTVTGVTIDGNTASGNAADNGGGGVFSDGGSTSIVETAISNNIANGTSGNGGGLHVAGGTTTITNSTIAGNQAATGSGGGVAVAGGTVNHVNVTIAYNTAATGGGVANLGGTANAQNTIVGSNTAATGPDLSGTITSGDNNLIGTTAGATVTGPIVNSIVNVDPRLGILQANGGPTDTILPLSGSPALDAGADTGLATDQRGIARPQFGLFDIGAVELQDGDLQDVSVDGEGNLIVNGAGRIVVFANNGNLSVRINNEVFGPFEVDGRINITGSGGADYIVLAGRIELGADIFGGDGNDYIAGSAGDDSLIGGAGNDILFGSLGDNYLEGDEGNDRLEGREGTDTLLGGDGNDRLNGQFGNDTLDGGLGNDILSGGGDDDIVRGGDGNDVATGDDGNDIVLGESGSDQLFGRQGNDLVIGGEGADRVRTDLSSDIVIGNATNLDADDQALQAVLAELIAGGGFDNIVNGTGGVPQLSGVEDNAIDELIGDTDPDLYYSTLNDFIRNLRTEDTVVGN